MRVLGLVPARGGSKGIPRKNIRPLGGRPLLAFTAEAALASKELSRVVLSTEDEEIASVGLRCGLEVPFLRPTELAGDDTPMLLVVQHALGMLEQAGQEYDAVCLLQPTSPFRRVEDIDGCIRLLRQKEVDSVVSVARVPEEYNPHWVFFLEGDGLLRLSTGRSVLIPRRQELPAAFHRDGSVYVTRREVILGENSLYGRRIAGYLVDREPPINLDSWDDWDRAEALLKKKKRGRGVFAWLGKLTRSWLSGGLAASRE